MATRKFIVTVRQVIVTEIEIDALSAQDARRMIEAYGPGEAVKDMSREDISAFVKIKSVKARQ
jgi:Arc/MetJ family transcription regulator